MSDTKWTKGPWVKGFGATPGHIKSAPSDAIPHNTPTPTVCRYDIFVIPDAEQEANAHLIAAAPELYDCLSKIHERCLSGDFYNDYDSGLKMLSDARAALSKARGETE